MDVLQLLYITEKGMRVDALKISLFRQFSRWKYKEQSGVRSINGVGGTV